VSPFSFSGHPKCVPGQAEAGQLVVSDDVHRLARQRAERDCGADSLIIPWRCTSVTVYRSMLNIIILSLLALPLRLPEAVMSHTLNVHGARPTMGHFRREWVAPEVSEANWKTEGVVYRDPDGITLFAIISQLQRGDEVACWVSRFSEVDGCLMRYSTQELPSLDAAMEVLAADVRRSHSEHGRIAKPEWPKDREPPRLLAPESRGWTSTLRHALNRTH
jgi:hypothetical protein